MKHAMIGNVSVALKENNDGTYEVLVDCGGEEVAISVDGDAWIGGYLRAS